MRSLCAIDLSYLGCHFHLFNNVYRPVFFYVDEKSAGEAVVHGIAFLFYEQ